MRSFWFLFLVFISLKGWANTQPFRLHITKAPSTYDSRFDTTNGYVLQNIHGRLFRWSAREGLKPELAKSCQWKKLVFECQLQDRKWSNGERITAQQIRDSFRAFFNLQKPSPYSFLLNNIKQADDISATETLLRFKFQKKDAQFSLKLSHPGLSVVYPKGFRDDEPAQNIYSGAYMIKEIKKNSSILLSPNRFYPIPPQLQIEFLILADDATANSLYEQGRLDYLRRVPAAFIPTLQGKPDFYMLPTYRLDHFALDGETLEDLRLRKALATSLDYVELQKILSAPQKIGCAGIAKDWVEQELCIASEPVSETERKYLIEKYSKTPLTFTYNAAGGDDHRRVAEWLQMQWKSKIGLDIRVRSLENKIFLADLATGKLQIYRRGVSPDIPSCWASVEAFHSHSPNYVMKSLEGALDQDIDQLENEANSALQKKQCGKIILSLLKQYRIIPTGQIYWAIRASPKFIGWQFNELGELDLSNLVLSAKSL